MNWEVIAYGSGDFLRMIFTAIASIFGNADYKAAMQTAGMLGFVAVLFKAAFDRNVMANFRWFIGVIVFIMVVLVPKTTVIVNDRINPANSAVVNNVPIGLAATASFFSFTGDWLARSFETVFSMPNDVKYTSNGLLFAHKLYETSRKLRFPDDRINNNFSEFFSSCVVVDGIGHNRFTWGEVLRSSNLINFFDTRVAANAASFKYTATSGTESILPCRSGFTNTLKPELQAAYPNIIQDGIPGDFISRFDSASGAQTKMTGSMPNVMSFLTGVTQSTQSIVVQNAIINAMAEGTHKLSAETNATEQAAYITSGAELHRLTTYHALGNIASEKLPLLRMIFEAVIYAIFPIVVLMAIIIPSKVPMAYITALVWINLWAPMYAILHFVMSYYTQQVLPEYAALYGNGFSVLSHNSMSKVNADIVATTGYLATSLPMLAWMLVSRSGAMAASLAGRMMQGYDQSVEKGANEVVDGQGRRMGTTWEQTGSGGIQNTTLMDSGSRATAHADGRNTIQQATSQLVVDAKATESTIQAKQQAVENAVSVQQTERTQLAESNTAALTNSGSVLQQLSREQGTNNNFRQSETVQQQENFTALKSAVDDWAKSNGIEMTDQQKAAMYGAIEGKITAEVGTPLKGIFGSGASTSVTTKAGGTIEGSTSNTEKDAYNMAERFTESEQFSNVVSTIGAGVREMAATFGLKENEGSVDQLNASLAQQQTAQREYSEAVSRVETAKESLNSSQELRAAIGVDGGQVIYDELMRMNGNDVQAVESILFAAQRGDEGAMTEIKQALIDADQRYDMSNNQNFQRVMDAMFDEGKEGVNNAYSGGTATVQGQGGEWRAEVDGQAPVTAEQVDSATTAALASQQAVMNDPSSVMTPNGTSERLQRLSEQVSDNGLETQATVETITHLENTAIGSEVAFNRGVQEADAEDLAESAPEKYKALMEKRRANGDE